MGSSCSKEVYVRFVAAFLFGGVLFAQSQLATLSGTVVDASAGVSPGAELKLTNQETGEAWSAITNHQGNYGLPLIKPGKYRLDIDKSGFKPYRQTEIVLETGGQHRIDVRLDLGTQAERV